MDTSTSNCGPRRVLAFLLYDPQGRCDESTLHVLRGFRPYVDHLLVVSNGKLRSDARTEVSSIADDLLERENVGYDVGAYRDALAQIGWERLAQFDELLLANYTFFGPVGSFGPVLDRMWGTEVDFWGMTDHPSVTPDPVSGNGTLPEHLQSFWLAVRRPLLKSDLFRSYWLGLDDPRSYEEVVAKFETNFTQHFAELGFKWASAYPASDYGVQNPAMEAPLALLRDGCPLFKKRLYFHDAPWLARQGVFSGAVTAEAVARGYPEDFILGGVHRRATVRELSFGLDATFMVPETNEGSSETSDTASEAEMVTGRPWRRLAVDGVDALLGESELLVVDAKAPERGSLSDGAISSYDYANSAVVSPTRFLNKLFASHPKMAAVFPYMDLLSNPVDGREWLPRTKVAAEAAEMLGLSGPFSSTSILAPYRGIAAYRRSLLESVGHRISHAGGWRHLVEAVGDEETLAQILDLLVGDVAKEEGWFVGQVATETELRRSASLLQDAYSRTPYVHPGYLDYPYSGKIEGSTLKNHLGEIIKARSPHVFNVLNGTERRLANSVRQMTGRLSDYVTRRM